MNFSKTVLATILGTFISGLLVILVGFIFISAIVGSAQAEKEVKVEDNTVLKLNLSGEVVDRLETKPFDVQDVPFLSGPAVQELNDIKTALKKAKDDERIDGVIVSPGMMSAGWATVEEIRESLMDFKSSGKFVYAYGEVYTEKTYYIATAADSIFVYPTGGMELNGLASTPMFFKGMFEKLELEPKIFRVGTFKSAVEPFMVKEMSDANRLQTQTFLNDMWGHFIKGVKENRDIPEDKLAMLSDSMKVETADDAVEYGLMDGTWYGDEVIDLLMKRTGAENMDDLEVITTAKYAGAKVDSDKKLSKDKVAIVWAEGEIVDGKGGDDNIGSASLVKELRKVRNDSSIKAVVFRVNSPGGSALASDVIAREVNLIKENKPIVVSMGDLAASGGYYISAGADKIYAQENTLTGSIGVFGLMLNTQKFFENKTGITFDRVYTNPMADIGNPNREMEQMESDKIQNSVNRIYGEFINVVLEGRKDHFDDSVAVDAIAQGRVWSGLQAKEIGLVDEIGGIDDALAAAIEMAGLEDGYRLREFPEKKDPFEELLKSMNMGEVSQGAMLEGLEEEVELYKELKTMLSRDGVYMLMPYDYNIE